MRMPTDRIIDSSIKKYGLPDWVRPYVYRYAKANPVSAVRFAISLVDVKRKKGEVTKSHVRLPNGKEFRLESILKVLNLFFYGEERMARIERAWANSPANHDAEYERKFMEMAEIDSKRTRAIKNLVEGIGRSVGSEPESLARSFEKISRIDSWHDRVIATGITLRYSYARTFGIVFYRVFYPVSPEFMRSFGKAFEDRSGSERWDTAEATRLIKENIVDREHVLELNREILSHILQSIDANAALARELGIGREVKLLGDISIAYPFEKLREIGMDIDVEDEVKLVKEMRARR